MTLILGVSTPTRMFLAADTLAYHSDHMHLAQPKIYERGDFFIGASGSYALGNCISHHFQIPARRSSYSDEVYVFRYVYLALRKALANLDLVTHEDGEPTIQGSIMLTYNKALYVLQENCALLKIKHAYAAIGLGSSYALGAYSALNVPTSSLTTVAKIKEAFRITSTYCASVGQDVTILQRTYL
jgi:hypothetical protein